MRVKKKILLQGAVKAQVTRGLGKDGSVITTTTNGHGMVAIKNRFY